MKKPDMYVLKKVLVQQYLDNNKKDEAKAVLNSVIKADNKSANSLSARVDLVKIALAENDRATANRLLDEIFVLEPSNTDARIQSARIKMAENKTKDAIADLRTAIKNDARSLEAYRFLAVAQEKDGTQELALDSYYRAIDIKGDDIPSILGAARISLNLKQVDNAKKMYEHVLTLNSNNVEANFII